MAPVPGLIGVRKFSIRRQQFVFGWHPHIYKRQGLVELVGAIIGSLLGAVVALFVAGIRLRQESDQWRQDARRESEQWSQDALVKGMGFLVGGRQQRSVGIGLLEALILSGNVPTDIRPAVDNVIWNQLNYVVFHGDIKQRHEANNALRLIALVRKSPDKSVITEFSEKRLGEMADRVPQS